MPISKASSNAVAPGAKGDLVVGTTTNDSGILGVGSNGETLVADSSQTTGLRWGNNYGFTGGKNLLINGAFQINQRATSLSGLTGNGYYTSDRWNTNISGAVGTWTQSVQNVAGLGNSLKMLCTTAKTPLDAGSLIRFRQEIEGQNLQNIRKGTASAQPLTVSFWVKSNVTGTYTVNMYDRDNNRQISGTYTISVADTWEKKSVTLVADTTGTFDNDSSSSAYLSFILLAGTNFTSGTLQTSWGSYTAANEASSSQANVASAINNYWEIAKVQMEIGSVATEFQLAAGTLAGELQAAQRYYIEYGGDKIFERFGGGSSDALTSGRVITHMPVPMRTTPSMTTTTTDWQLVRPGIAGAAATAITLSSDESSTKIAALTVTIGSTAGFGDSKAVVLCANSSTSARIRLSAEL
jgi:hypothetical protein